ncbi:MAG: DUF1800 domain-containing protein [Planctomycetes bacterium]|nr:DUF1800 domain-containing protein [Planctomycetota bacterium]
MSRHLARFAALVLLAGTASLAVNPNVFAEDIPSAKAKEAPKGLDDDQRIVHFLNRFTLGCTPALVAEVKAKGLKAWLQAQLMGTEKEPQFLRDRLTDMRSLELSSAQIADQFVEKPGKDATPRERREARELENTPARELTDSIILRGVYSANQVREVSADIFRNHFAVSLDKGPVKLMAVDYERNVVRRYALDQFGAMLKASAHHPAMLFYLDNCLSCRPATPEELEAIARRGKNNPERVERARQRGLNENYARELMELHTLGVDNYYTQDDVINVAKCLTGWGISPRHEENPLAFWFRADFHSTGDKTVLGQTIKPNIYNPQAEGEEVLDLLIAHKGTARFIAFKLCRWLVNDQPSDAVVGRIAAVFEKTKGDLAACYMAIYEDPEFFNTVNYMAKYKRPFEFAVSALRATGSEIKDCAAIQRGLVAMAEPLYRCANPTGYYDHAEAWQDPGAMSLRWKAAMDLAKGRIPGVKVPDSLYADLPQDKPEQWKDRLAAKLLCVPLSETTSHALDDYVARALKDNPRVKARELGPEIVAGLLGSPEFQKQ